MSRKGEKRRKATSHSAERSEETLGEHPSGILIEPPTFPRKGEKREVFPPELAKILSEQHKVPQAEQDEILERFRAGIRDGKGKFSKIESESQEGEGCAMAVRTPNGHRVVLIIEKIQGKLTVRLPDVE